MIRKHVWRYGEDGKGHWMPLDMNAPLPPRKTPYVVRDIETYRSVITGEPITGRAQHREHLAKHGCFELGNEYPTQTYTPMPSVAQDVQAAMQASAESHAEARVMSERGSAVGPIDRILP